MSENNSLKEQLATLPPTQSPLTPATPSPPVVYEALFKPSEWDDYPLKQDDKYTNKIIQPEFAPFNQISETLPSGFQFQNFNVQDEHQVKLICNFLNGLK